jgi:hypothetical protein
VVFFGSVALSGPALPVAALAVRPEIFRPLLPIAIVAALGGLAVTAFILRRRPMSVAVCAGAMMLLLSAAASVWMFPYLEQFKSHRQFAAEINRRVPAAAPLYVYEDTTNDFNYYARREKIPVLDGPAEIARLRDAGEKSYVLIKERALRKLPAMAAEAIIARRTLGDTTWYLLVLGK